MFLAIWSLAAQNVLLYHLVPGGTKCFIVPFGPWRHKMFHCTIWSLAAQNVFIVPFGPWRHKMLETCDPEGVRCGILGKFVPPG